MPHPVDAARDQIRKPTQYDTAKHLKPAGHHGVESWPAAIVASSNDAIIGRSLDNVIVYWNAAATRTYGYQADEMTGRPITLLVPLELWNEEVRRSEELRIGGRIENFETIRLHKDGTRIAVEMSLSPVHDADGRLVGISEIAREMLDRKQGEQRGHSLQERRLMQPESKPDGNEKLDRLEGEFTASVSHELRTPLHTIIGFADLLAEERHGPLNEKQRGFLRHIHTDSQHLLSLINDVLDFTRIDSGESDVRPEVLPLRDLVSDALDAMNVYGAGRNVSLRQGEITTTSVVADDMRLRKILSSLLHNGVKFTHAGGEVSVDAVDEGDFVKITVSDTGIGIPSAEHARIFDKFYQFGFTTFGVREGTGLGLTICKQLVELQGGKIWVDSEPGQGSHFHFTMPRATANLL